MLNLDECVSPMNENGQILKSKNAIEFKFILYVIYIHVCVSKYLSRKKHAKILKLVIIIKMEMLFKKCFLQIYIFNFL